MAGNQIAVIVPVLREADNIKSVVEALSASLSSYDWEVIFVDDDSDDGTFELARELSRNHSSVRAMQRVGKRGLATAAIAGMLSAHADYIVVMDGDGQHDANTIPDLITPLQAGRADIVSASRQLDAMDDKTMTAQRRNLSKFANRIAEVFAKRKISDPMSGFFAISADAFQSVVRRLGDAGFKLLLDILICGPALRHEEVSFGFRPRAHGESKLDARNAWQLATFLAARLTNNIIPQRFISFVAVGTLGLAVHFSVLYLLLGVGYGFATGQVWAAVLATIFNFLLNNSLTFRDRKLHGGNLVAGLMKYLLITSVGIFANVAVATQVESTFTGYFALSALAGIAIDTVWKFFMSGLVVWSRK